MNFLKRYYDKVILLILFIVFVVLMLYVWNVVEQTNEVDDAKLKLSRAVPDPDSYGKYKNTDKDFQYNMLWQNKKFYWQKGNRAESASDLIEMTALAECPYCSEKSVQNGGGKILVNRSTFGNKCSGYAGSVHDLPVPELTSISVVGGSGGIDSDGDGISDADEEKFKMNKDDKRDALYDNDGDGFSNRFEIAKSTDPNDHTSHPPLWHRLRVVKIAAAKLPIQLIGVNTFPKNGKDSPKEDWEIFCRVPRYNRRKGWQSRDTTTALGNRVIVDYDNNSKYEIVDVAKSIDATKNIVFTVKLKEIVPAKLKMEPHYITMTSGKSVYSWDARPVIQDTGRPGSDPVIKPKGGSFTIHRLQNSNIDKHSESYEVVDFQISNGVVSLRNISSNEEIKITREGEIPRREVVVKRD